MRMYDLIDKKKHGQALTEEEIEGLIQGYTKGDIPEYQMSALLMAIYFQGMSDEETAWMTMSMAKSGQMLDLSAIEGIKVDKHSTGGVGDKTSMIVAPIVSSLGIPVAKMSGRGLGHTGGTIDKLESIPGFSTSLSQEEFIKNVNQIKMAIAGQTANLAPADKKLYALRDVTATVDQKSLIASSIMSKKIASGADAIVLDVKTGSGAFMKEEKEAIDLARIMVAIGNHLGRDTTAIISDMNQPLGNAVGNSLEVIEAIETLKGDGPKDLVTVCIELAAHMIYHAKKARSIDEARKMAKDQLDSKKALEQFKCFVAAQGGDVNYIEDSSLFQSASYTQGICALEEGYIYGFDTQSVGIAAMILGGGRETKDSPIDLSVGFVLEKKIGDYIKKGDVLAYMHGNDQSKMEAAKETYLDSVKLSKNQVEPVQMIKEVIA